MAQSPAHFRYFADHPVEETAAMRLGAYAHHLILGGSRDFAVFSGQRRGVAWTDFRDDHPDATVLTRDEADTAEQIMEAVLSSTLAMTALHGERERTVTWSVAGRDCGGTPDVVGAGFVTELKVSHAVNPERFRWHALRSLWHAQLAWYADGVGGGNRDCLIVAVEPKPPHCVVVYSLTADCIEAGRATWRGLFERLMVCEASDEWPGYSQAVLPLESNDPMSLTVEGEEIEL